MRQYSVTDSNVSSVGVALPLSQRERKYVFIVNGSGGVGKDTVCALAACY